MNPNLGIILFLRVRAEIRNPLWQAKQMIPNLRFQEPVDQTERISSIFEKTNSKKPLSNITSFQLLIFQRGIKVSCSCFAVGGFSPFFTINLPWKILLHSLTPWCIHPQIFWLKLSLLSYRVEENRGLWNICYCSLLVQWSF